MGNTETSEEGEGRRRQEGKEGQGRNRGGESQGKNQGREKLETQAKEKQEERETGFSPPEVATIPALPQEKKRLRVCSYNRVSSLLEEQHSSVENQESHFAQYIQEKEEWIYCGAYVDDGISGTGAKKRPELQRLLRDCREGKVDLILTKSISRFARNTQECLEMVRELTSLGVSIFFERENIHTGTMESELMLTLLATFAEGESRSISGNMKWSIRRKFHEGSYQQAVVPYGYVRKDGVFVIEEQQAETVRFIFRLATLGKGGPFISKFLNERGIPSPRGCNWTQATLRKILENPVYMGDMLFQKTFKDENYKQRNNRGELDQFYIENHHEGIVSRDTFLGVQELIRERNVESGYFSNGFSIGLPGVEPSGLSSGHAGGLSSDPPSVLSGDIPGENPGHLSGKGQKRKKACFSGLLVCSVCGGTMYRQKGTKEGMFWICSRHLHAPKECQMKPQSEQDIKAAFLNCLNKMAWSRTLSEGILDIYERLLAGDEKEGKETKENKLQEIEMLLGENRRKRQSLEMPSPGKGSAKAQRKMYFLLLRQEKSLLAEKNRLLHPVRCRAIF